MRWSKNVADKAPTLIAPEDFSPQGRAYPFANTAPDTFVIVSTEGVYFKGQRGPIKDVGVNGCQIDDVITFALGTIKTFNKKFPCRENSLAITDLESALNWLERRRRDREDRGVEGLDRD